MKFGIILFFVLLIFSSALWADRAQFFNYQQLSFDSANFFPLWQNLNRQWEILTNFEGAKTNISAGNYFSRFSFQTGMAEIFDSDFKFKIGVSSFSFWQPLFFSREKNIETQAIVDLKQFFPLKIEATAGPSYQVDSLTQGYLPKPGKSLGILTTFSDFNIFGRYQVRYSAPGSPEINRLSGGVSYRVPVLNGFNLEVGGESFSRELNFLKSDLLSSFKWRLETIMEPVSGIELSSTFSGRKLKDEELLVGAKIKVKNYFQTGTDFALEGYRIGADYFSDGLRIAPAGTVLNSFDSFLTPGRMGLGAEVRQEVLDETLSLLGRLDVNFGQNYKNALWRLGVAYNITSSMQIEAEYRKFLRSLENKNSQDYLTAGMSLEF